MAQVVEEKEEMKGQHNANEAPRPHDFKAYVGIDFGTDGTAMAFAIQGSTEIYLEQDWNNTGVCLSTKTRTCILLNRQKEFLKFGTEAQKTYIIY